MVSAKTPVRRFWVPQNTVRANALCGILLYHIFAALQNLRFRLFGQQKRRQPRTLYASFFCVTGDIVSMFVLRII